MKLHIIILALLALPLAMMGQERGQWSIMPYAGVNLTNISNDELYAFSSDEGDVMLKSKTKAGLIIGADLEYTISPMWGAVIGLNYAQQGCQFDTYIEPSTMEEMKFRQYLHYLNLTIMPKCYLGSGFAVETGVQVGALLSAKSKMEENGKESSCVDMKNYYKKLSASIPIGLSFEYENVQLRLRYHIPLNNILDIDADTKEKNSQLSFTVGYRFGL